MVNKNKANNFFKQKIILIALGLLFAFIILEAGLRLGGFIFLSLQEHKNRLAIQKKGSYRILCLGESTTADQYPSFLQKKLNNIDVGVEFSVIDKGMPGINTSFILDNLEYYLDKYKPDMVITMMGINDEGPSRRDAFLKSQPFFKSFRIYKLTRLIWDSAASWFKDLDNKDSQIKKIPEKEKELYFGDYRRYFKFENNHRNQNKHIQAKNLLKRAIEFNPENYLAYTYLGIFYNYQEKFDQAEESLKKAIELNPEICLAYVYLGDIYFNQNKHIQAKNLLKKAIELNPENYLAHANLGIFYIDFERYVRAEESLKKAIELNPGDPRIYVYLGIFYFDREKHLQAEELLKKAIELNPESYLASVYLAIIYSYQGKYFQAEKLLEKAVELNPDDPVNSYAELVYLYRIQKKFNKAENLLLSALMRYPEEYMVHGALMSLYLEVNNLKLAKKYNRKLTQLKANLYSRKTTDNYLKLKKVLDKKGITYVCMQYPMRSIKVLKDIFKRKSEGIIFVDNEKIFKDAVRKAKYSDYFRNQSGGDFGHCTDKGNKLLAENIAQAILKEVFGK